MKLNPTSQEIFSVIGCLTLKDAMEGELISSRLVNGLTNADLWGVNFRDIALELDNFLASFGRFPNVGNVSLQEISRTVRGLVPRLLREKSISNEDVDRVCNELFGELMDDEAVNCSDSFPTHRSLEECLSWLMLQCKDRDRKIIERRFAIQREQTETLEEIGLDYGISRERIRQIEKRGLKTMRIISKRLPLEQHVATASAMEWLHISEGCGWVADRKIEAVLQRLSGVILLGLAILGTSSREWLENNSKKLSHGLIGAPLDLKLMSAATDEVAEFTKLSLPRSIHEVKLASCDEKNRVHIEAAIVAGAGLELNQGYVVQSKPGLRLRRALSIHRILTSSDLPIKTAQLIELYHALCPTDPCSIRDATIVMQAAPHLFIETFDNVWFGIGSCGDPIPVSCAIGGIDMRAAEFVSLDSDEESETCAASLFNALERRGPERLISLYQDADDVLPPGRSPNSIGPTLLCNAHLFLRLLPGVYGLHHQVPTSQTLLSSPPAYLLNDVQLHYFALARRARESRDVFPLWSTEAEFALARWGRHSGSRANFRSLLAVADIDQWPVSDTERIHWKKLAELEGRFELGEPLRQDAYIYPEIDRLAAACIEATAAGELNWMAVNRMAGRRIDSHRGASIIITMLALGALEIKSADPHAWQLPHISTSRTAILSQQLSHELCTTGSLSWDAGIGQILWNEIRSTKYELACWLSSSRLASMFEVKEPKVDSSSFAEIDPLDAIMAESRQLANINRREDLLQWLLEQ